MNNFQPDGKQVKHIGSSWRVARKVHACGCGENISKGTRYSRDVYVVDGEVQVVNDAQHAHAWEAEEAAYQRANNWF